MTEPGIGEQQIIKSKIESFVKNNEALCRVFLDGVNQHLQKLESENQPDNEEVPEISQALERYNEIKNLVDSKFTGYQVRQTLIKHEANKLYISLARPEDVQKQNSSFLDIRPGSPPKSEFVIAIGSTSMSSFSNSPEKVLDSRGFSIEIMKQNVSKDESGVPSFSRESGFSVQLSATGASRGNATKYDGRMPYDSRNAYDIGANMNKEVTDLYHSVKELHIFNA